MNLRQLIDILTLKTSQSNKGETVSQEGQSALLS